MARAASGVREYLGEVDTKIARAVVPGLKGRELLERIPESFRHLGSVRLEMAGSAFCGTSVAGYSDVDVLVVFTDPIRRLLHQPNWLHDLAHGTWKPASGSLPYSLPDVLDALAEETPRGSEERRRTLPEPPVPSSVFAEFVDCLDTLAPPAHGFGAPVPDFPAVKFVSQHDEASIELVPALEADFLWDRAETAQTPGLSFRVFPGTRDRWLGTHPELHNATLMFGRGGSDYTCRELVRLLKLLLKYVGRCPLRSYFVELFVLRWIEGSHDLSARTVPDIIDRMNSLGRRPYAHTGPLSRDVVSVLSALAAELRVCIVEGRILDTVDLTTPETEGQTEACETMDDIVVCSQGVERIHAMVAEARRLEESGDARAAVSVWRQLVGDSL